MPPKPKFTRKDIIENAMELIQESGIESLTARDLGKKLGTSCSPIFTCFSGMDEIKIELREKAEGIYSSYLQKGLSGPIPFMAVGEMHIRFAKEEPELYKLLFLSDDGKGNNNGIKALNQAKELVRESLMNIYNMDQFTADCYFRDLWLVAHGFASLCFAGNAGFSDEEIRGVFTEMSLSVCKAYKEIPGLPEGKYDRDSIFRSLVEK